MLPAELNLVLTLKILLETERNNETGYMCGSKFCLINKEKNYLPN